MILIGCVNDMMMNKRLIGTVRESKKYVVGNVISQWISLAVNIGMMAAIAKMLQSLYIGTIGSRQIVLTAILAVVAVGFRFLCAVVSSRMSSFFERGEENSSPDDL